MRYGHFDDERREYVITGPDTPLPWINYLGTEEFFGIVSHTGLRLDPVLPAEWSGFTATRRFRGATYKITVRKPSGSRGRLRRLYIDGTLVNGTLLPLAKPGSVVHVEADVE